MIVYAEIECFFYNGHSLKEKRSLLKRLINKLRRDFNISIAEIDYQDLWQRTKIGIAVVSNELTHGEKVIQEVLKIIDAEPEIERTITTVDRL